MMRDNSNPAIAHGAVGAGRAGAGGFAAAGGAGTRFARTFWCWWCFIGASSRRAPADSRWPSSPGLALDVIHGVVLGQHALALTLDGRLGHASAPAHPRVLGSVAVPDDFSRCSTGYQFVLFWVDGATGNPVTTFSRWLAPFIGALLWPLLVSAHGQRA